MNQYANMVGNICLDKEVAPEGGKSQPITFEVWRIQNGSMFPGSNPKDRVIASNLDSVEKAIERLHEVFIKHLNGDRFSPSPSFWKENYQAATSTPANWGKRKKHSFRFDDYSIAICTSNRKLVY